MFNRKEKVMKAMMMMMVMILMMMMMVVMNMMNNFLGAFLNRKYFDNGNVSKINL